MYVDGYLLYADGDPHLLAVVGISIRIEDTSGLFPSVFDLLLRVSTKERGATVLCVHGDLLLLAVTGAAALAGGNGRKVLLLMGDDLTDANSFF